eukprot:CAMPEP_0181197898 /NCGR_PEP_ID=MMETSP1096-20121128/16302_1 /TAXON_ID=156174 ORGANISM="Chrysochromulina ericina, Strain CCMP281" /NCGR_SAMPLE_ID=MMETSP1096 /ASSEMBLY_ACC=CAM_ASM_000453 /LENGTH=138 /DNA_ID=CAMNT_0023287871 /DNA_START=156 /DNA_END=572 /DNA_ORIENTATION=+
MNSLSMNKWLVLLIGLRIHFACAAGSRSLVYGTILYLPHRSSPYEGNPCSQAIRYVLYGIFGLSSAIGVGIAGSNGEFGNAAVNAAALVAAGGAFFVDQKLTSELREKTKREMANPMLKGGSGMYGTASNEVEEDANQ